ncbi:hypothetical protein HJC10_08225 [Corallococcus exiguus]|nr:hypothetical protein [Corallococcus exiguus]
MPFDQYHRLEPKPGDRDLQEGFHAAVFDPLWFLARQWQMGEHQGENATSPVAVRYRLRQSAIRAPDGFDGDTRFDPAITPAEAIIESELDDWWTMGRRIRIGAAIAERAHIDPEALESRPFLFDHPPSPYDRFHGRFDGRALWRSGIGQDLARPGERPPSEGPFTWQSEALSYEASFPSGAGRLDIPRHRGGRIDWHSAETPLNTIPAQPDGEEQEHVVFATPFEYPGAPHSRWWQIENASVDIGGYPPDPAHFPTMLLVDLIFSHGDDWFVFPVAANAANFVQLDVEVFDSFGNHYHNVPGDQPRWPGLMEPKDWSLFRTTGQPRGLALWLTAATPLEGGVLEEVQFGLDEYSNRLWAVERRIDGQDVMQKTEPSITTPRLNEGMPSADRTKPREYAYVPSDGVAPYWHPYELEEVAGARRFVLHGFADLSRATPVPMPYPQAEVLLAGTPAARELHRVDPATVPANGLTIERRWMLARDTCGRPVLWLQRQRKPRLSPPGRTVRFDVLEELRAP